VNNAWIDLEYNGLRDYAVKDQLKACTGSQRFDLRNMILSRMESFNSFAKQIKKSKEEQEKIVRLEKEKLLEKEKEIMSLKEREKLLEEVKKILRIETEKEHEKLLEKEKEIVNLESEITSKEQLYFKTCVPCVLESSDIAKLKQVNENAKLVVELGEAEWR